MIDKEIQKIDNKESNEDDLKQRIVQEKTLGNGSPSTKEGSFKANSIKNQQKVSEKKNASFDEEVKVLKMIEVNPNQKKEVKRDFFPPKGINEIDNLKNEQYDFIEMQEPNYTLKKKSIKKKVKKPLIKSKKIFGIEKISKKEKTPKKNKIIFIVKKFKNKKRRRNNYLPKIGRSKKRKRRNEVTNNINNNNSNNNFELTFDELSTGSNGISELIPIHEYENYNPNHLNSETESTVYNDDELNTDLLLNVSSNRQVPNLLLNEDAFAAQGNQAFFVEVNNFYDEITNYATNTEDN